MGRPGLALRHTRFLTAGRIGFASANEQACRVLALSEQPFEQRQRARRAVSPAAPQPRRVHLKSQIESFGPARRKRAVSLRTLRLCSTG